VWSAGSRRRPFGPHQRLRREGADHGGRRLAARQEVGLKHHADEACADAPTIEHVIVVDRFGDGVHMVPRRDHCGTRSWTARMTSSAGPRGQRAHALPAVHVGHDGQAEGHPAYPPGYLLGSAFTHWAVFDIKPDDVYWCAADIGWVTGHSYIVYGPLANATTGILYEGGARPPPGPLVEIVEDYKVRCCTARPRRSARS